MRAPQQEVNRILALLTVQQPQLFTTLERYGVRRATINTQFRIAINFTLDMLQVIVET
jgi:hypothetical protein